MSGSPGIRYEFGLFQVDAARSLLLRGGEVVPLTPKVFGILLALVESSGRVVSKEELLRRVWPGTNVEEGNLTQSIFVLRRVLGESPNDHRYIVTVPGHGYRFVAPTREIRGGADDDDPAAVESIEPAGTAAAAARAPSSSSSSSSIAVLPFTHLGDNGGEYFGPGMADALITRLSNIRQIVVRPTTSVLKYTDLAGRDPVQAGRELGVDSVLDGMIQRDGERIRVSVQLLRVRDGKLLWAETFNEDFTDMFTVQDRVSEQVALALMLKLTSEEQRLLTKRYTENTEAFKAYLKVRHFWNKRTVEGLKRAIVYANEAIDIDPTYALAYVGLADSYNLLPGHGGLSPKDNFPRARAAAQRALGIDETLAEAQTSLGLVKYRYDWDWEAGEQQFRRAIELKPNYATAHHWYGECLAMLGRFDESIAELKLAQELDPLSLPINADLGQSYFFARQYDQAIKQIRKALEMDPNFVRARVILGAAYEQKWMYRDAIAVLGEAAELEAGTNTLALSGLGHACAVSGENEEARKVLKRLKEMAAQRYVSAYSIAIVYTGLDERSEALEWLHKAYEDRCVWLVWLKVNPRFDRLRAEPRFQQLLRRIGLA